MRLPTKAVIVAAGQGRRCRPHTDSLPKCLLPINGKSILEHQLEALKANGITEIALVRGYRAEKFVHRNIRYYDNADYEKNNILESLMVAEEELNGDCLISYGDILYTPAVVDAAAAFSGDLGVVVDTAWRERYVGRLAHPVSEAEKVIADERGVVLEIGKHIADGDAVFGEFIGLCRLSSRGCRLLRKMFLQAKSRYNGRPFHHALSMRQAYLTDMFEEISHRGVSVHTIPIRGNWAEIDTVEDYEYAQRMFCGECSLPFYDHPRG